jgi:lipoate-protein ligase A
MHSDLAGALEQINKGWKAFEHRGKPMTKDQVRKVLKYGLSKGYKTTAELTDEEVDNIIGTKFSPAFKDDGTFIGTD